MNTIHPNVINRSQPKLEPRYVSQLYARLGMFLSLVEAV